MPLPTDKKALALSEDLLKATLERIKSPAPGVYGTSACPASSADDVVLLTRVEKAMALVSDT